MLRFDFPIINFSSNSKPKVERIHVEKFICLNTQNRSLFMRLINLQRVINGCMIVVAHKFRKLRTSL